MSSAVLLMDFRGLTGQCDELFEICIFIDDTLFVMAAFEGVFEDCLFCLFLSDGMSVIML